MKPWGPTIRSEQGVALPLALIVLVALTGLLLVFLGLGSTESLIGRNHADLTEARFVAEAGIEFAFDVLANTPDWNSVLVAGNLATAMPLPGLPAVFGTFTVTVRNDSQADDNQITGVAPDLDPFIDTNGRVIVTAVGVVGNATRRIQVAVRRTLLPPIVGAFECPGVECDATFNGNSFVVTGDDTNMDGTPGPGSPVWGIAVATGNVANETVVQNSLSGPQKNNVLGKQQDTGQPPWGDNTIAPDPALTSAAIADFVTAVKAQADLSLISTPASPLSFTNLGASCATDPSGDTCWGTQSQPKLVYIKGDPDPTQAFWALQVSGTSTGGGILIVEDGDFRITGNFRWDGLIIVTGQYVGITYAGGGWQTVYGSVISNETASDPGFKEALISGNAKINYSTQAIDLARQIRKLLALGSWREL